MRDFRNIQVWSKSHRLALEVYEASRKFPNDERYGLTAQMRRSAASIPTNIAEGCGRGSEADFARFLQIAAGSASELEYQLLLACDLKLLNKQTYEQLNRDVTEVKRMLYSFIATLKAEG
jgi:four helix bundle protein